MSCADSDAAVGDTTASPSVLSTRSAHGDDCTRWVILVMGVCGCGKTSVGKSVAEALSAVFYEGDDFHSDANKTKMRRGEPLTDADRWPWLDSIATVLAKTYSDGGRAVVACSALKRKYRDRLREYGGPLYIVHLTGSFDAIDHRMKARKGHYMNPALLASQFDALEPPQDDEDAIVVDVSSATPSEVEGEALRLLRPLLCDHAKATHQT